jgi:BetI-type transcriptional repressor, C-terminal
MTHCTKRADRRSKRWPSTAPPTPVRAALQAERLHALIDGLAVHTALRPDLMPPDSIVAVLRLAQQRADRHRHPELEPRTEVVA